MAKSTNIPGLTAAAARRELRRLANPEQAAFAQRFFKTGKGEYAEGDKFLGIRVPPVRKLVVKYSTMPLDQTPLLLASRWHEERLLAVLILARKFQRADVETREAIYRLYLDHARYVNNWDLVDVSAEHVVGGWLYEHAPRAARKQLAQLAKSKSLWERRIAVMATFYFIRRETFDETLLLVERLLNDEHDLLHKACGWMLREIGKRDTQALEAFLQIHYANMPRTMLRYAIERFPEGRRQAYLRGKA